MTDWRQVPADKAQGSLKSNQFEGFEAYSNAPVQDLNSSPADIKAEGDEAYRGYSAGSVPTDNYEDVE